MVKIKVGNIKIYICSYYLKVFFFKFRGRNLFKGERIVTPQKNLNEDYNYKLGILEIGYIN